MDDERFKHLEKEIDKLYRSHKALEDTMIKLNVTLVLLEQLVKDMKFEKEKRDALGAKVQFFVVGILISALMAFIINGGLAIS